MHDLVAMPELQAAALARVASPQRDPQGQRLAGGHRLRGDRLDPHARQLQVREQEACLRRTRQQQCQQQRRVVVVVECAQPHRAQQQREEQPGRRRQDVDPAPIQAHRERLGRARPGQRLHPAPQGRAHGSVDGDGVEDLLGQRRGLGVAIAHQAMFGDRGEQCLHVLGHNMVASQQQRVRARRAQQCEPRARG